MTRTLKTWAVVLGWLLLMVVAGLTQAQPRPSRAVQDANGRAAVAWLTARLWIREATGRNDGPAVAALVKAGGGVPAQLPEWCGFTQTACQRAHGLPYPGGGMQGAARAWFPLTGPQAARTVYQAGVRGALDSIRVGYKLGFAWRPNPEIHHITLAAEIVKNDIKSRPPRGFWSLGGNEGRGTNAGVHRSYYASPNITAASNWND